MDGKEDPLGNVNAPTLDCQLHHSARAFLMNDLNGDTHVDEGLLTSAVLSIMIYTTSPESLKFTFTSTYSRRGKLLLLMTVEHRFKFVSCN